MRKIKYIFTVLFAGLLLTSCSMFEKEGAGRASVSFKLDAETVQKIKKAAGETSSATARVADSDGLFIEVLVKGEYQARVPQALQEDAEITIKNIPLGVKIFVEANIYKMEKQTRKDLYTGHSKTFVVHENDNQVIFVLHKIAGSSESGNQGGGGNGGEGGNGSGEGSTDPFPNELPANVVFVANTTAGGSSSNDGSEEHPLDSIEHAVGKIKEIVQDANSGHSNDEEWGIVLLSDLSGTQKITDDADSYMSKLVLASKDAKDIKTLDGGFTTAPEDDSGTTLFISSMKEVTLQCVKITGGWAQNGGGIRYSGKYLYIKPGVEIYGNKARYHGAGIFVRREDYVPTNDINLTIDGGIIGGEAGKENICTGSEDGGYPGGGGGIYLAGLGEGIGGAPAILKIEKGYIKGNKADGGAGIYGVGECNVIMNGGGITENSYYEGGSSAGAGIYLADDHDYTPSFIMTGGSITSNTSSFGSGFCGFDAKIYIYGGTISGNTATDGEGAGVYVNHNTNKEVRDFEIKGNPDFGENDTVYLPSSVPIIVVDQLTGTAPVLRIQPASYTPDTTLVMDGCSPKLTAEEFADVCAKFAVVPNTDGTWHVSDGGLLVKD